MRAGSLLSQCQALQNAEAMLFINNRKVQVPEPDALLNEGMSSYEKFRLAAGSFR
jgi:hypothetical protein